MKVRFYCIILLCLGLIGTASCTSDSVLVDDDNNGNDYEDIVDEDLIPNSQNVSYDNAITIAYSTGGATVDNPYQENGVSITTNGGHVVITSTLTGTELNYILSGITTDGSLKIYGESPFGLVMNGVGITNPTGAAINIQCKKKATVTVVAQTNNRLIDGTTYTYSDDEDMKGTFFSEGELDFYGTGSLQIRSKSQHALCTDASLSIHEGTFDIANSGNAYYDTAEQDIYSSSGVKVKTDLLMTGGTLTVNSTGSGGKGINVGETITVDDGTISVTTTGGQFVYGSDDTAAKAIKADGIITINGGTITINTSEVEAEGLESKSEIYIHGGTIEIEAYDDCINATSHIEITGGSVYCNSATNDGIDSNGTITLSGGLVVSAGTTAPEEGVDCDQNRFAITGGTLIGIGGATSNPTASACTQPSLVYSFAGSNVKILRIEETTTGAEALTIELPRTHSSTVLLFSSPNLKASTGYSIYTGGTIAGGTSFHGYYSGATYTKGTQATTFTTSSMVTTVGTSGGGRP